MPTLKDGQLIYDQQEQDEREQAQVDLLSLYRATREIQEHLIAKDPTYKPQHILRRP